MEERVTFMINEDGTTELIEQERLNKYCYFCDFHDLTSHQHHIIRKRDGGKDDLDNLLPLCANHHELIHRRICILIFSRGYYYLKDKRDGKILSPTDRQKEFKRKLPYLSIKDNSKLILEGNIREKGRIIIKEEWAKCSK